VHKKELVAAFPHQNTSDATCRPDDTELSEINLALGKNGQMLKSLYESMVSGLITISEFVQMKAEYKAKIDALSLRADEIRQEGIIDCIAVKDFSRFGRNAIETGYFRSMRHCD